MFWMLSKYFITLNTYNLSLFATSVYGLWRHEKSLNSNLRLILNDVMPSKHFFWRLLYSILLLFCRYKCLYTTAKIINIVSQQIIHSLVINKFDMSILAMKVMKNWLIYQYLHMKDKSIWDFKRTKPSMFQGI